MAPLSLLRFFLCPAARGDPISEERHGRVLDRPDISSLFYRLDRSAIVTGFCRAAADIVATLRDWSPARFAAAVGAPGI